MPARLNYGRGSCWSSVNVHRESGEPNFPSLVKEPHKKKKKSGGVPASLAKPVLSPRARETATVQFDNVKDRANKRDQTKDHWERKT
jgi:hypothetical protein